MGRKKTSDQALRLRWEKRQARASEWDEPPERRNRPVKFGRVQVVRSQGPAIPWGDEDRIRIVDSRSQVTVLGFYLERWRETQPLWSSRPEGVGYMWRCYAGRGQDPEALLAEWDYIEFHRVFSQMNWKASLSSLLLMITCPMCESWTGGGKCFECAKGEAEDLYRRMQ